MGTVIKREKDTFRSIKQIGNKQILTHIILLLQRGLLISLHLMGSSPQSVFGLESSSCHFWWLFWLFVQKKKKVMFGLGTTEEENTSFLATAGALKSLSISSAERERELRERERIKERVETERGRET